MKIVAAGCSFTYNNEFTYAGWLADRAPLINAGSCAAGNAYISRAFLHHAYQDSNIIGICQWSGIHRQGWLAHHLRIPKNDISKGDYHNEEDVHKQEYIWVKTGGNGITSKNNTNQVDRFFVQPYLKYFYNKEQTLVETAEAILRVYHYCELKKIQCLMFWWKDELSKYKLGKFSKPLFDMITDNEYITWLPPLGDWCIQHTEFTQKNLDNGEHPTPAQSKLYGEKVIWPYVSKKIELRRHTSC